ncbi:hypothetical protein EVG20_g208 [Dentipellis fragilis]|uniref:Major facilitator superfamily (MFS) profile domain-containing protein n=1 Tax=Dentipellis fragilis TaxID=205917 RepID=A0A4Y9ZG77_9AGAM|nr:hypothetical protein EVG20_g208 [Dentipellis fragilis]
MSSGPDSKTPVHAQTYDANEHDGTHALSHDNKTNPDTRPGEVKEKPYSVFTTGQKWFIVSMASLAGIFSPLTANIYFPAIPVMASQFHKSVELINLTVTVYMIMQGISPMFWGTLSDRWGRRPMFLGCLLLLSLSCVGLALTPSSDYWLLMLLRCVQAAGSASTIALGAGVIADIASPAERGGFFGLFSFGPMVGPSIGPVIGGGLTQGLGWRAIFWFLCISSAVCLVVIFLFLPETLRSMVGDGSVPPPFLYRVGMVPVMRKARHDGTREKIPPRKSFNNPLMLFTYPDVVVLLILNDGHRPVFLGHWWRHGGRSLITGKMLDREYRVLEDKMIKQGKFDPEKKMSARDRARDSSFPLEVARLRTMPVFMVLYLGCMVGYGWCLKAQVSIAGPLILQFIMGYAIVSIMNAVQTLLVDLVPAQGSSITACNNLIRCSLGAAMVSVVNIIIDAVGDGWTYVILAATCVAVTPLLYVEVKWGPVWRERRRKRHAEQTVRGITEFIEVAIHTILYVRHIYPPDLFIRRKKYNTPVYQSRHPVLNEYITGAVKAIESELALGNVDKVVVVIKDKNEVALERFIFSIQTMIEMESFNKDTSVEEAIPAGALGQYFRSFLVKLNMIEAQLGELSLDADNSFAIVLELQDGKHPMTHPLLWKDEPPPWVPAVTEHTTTGVSEKADLHMVRAVNTGVINLSLAVQESEDKKRLFPETTQPKSKGKEKAV